MSSAELRLPERGKDPYLTQRIMSAGPEQLISYIYDAILTACRTGDRERALRGLMALVGALDFEYQEQAVPMYKLYQYCLDRAREGNLDEVKYIIGEFKEAWSEAHKVS